MNAGRTVCVGNEDGKAPKHGNPLLHWLHDALHTFCERITDALEHEVAWNGPRIDALSTGSHVPPHLADALLHASCKHVTAFHSHVPEMEMRIFARREREGTLHNRGRQMRQDGTPSSPQRSYNSAKEPPGGQPKTWNWN